MKHIIKNSALVFVLTSLFAIPVLGFNFIGYNPSNNVLGVSNVSVTNKKVVDGMSASTQTRSDIVEQLELKLSLSGDTYQKFYDVVPEYLVDSGYSYILVYPNDLQDSGMKASIEVNSLKADIVVTVPDTFTTQIVPVTILVVK